MIVVVDVEDATTGFCVALLQHNSLAQSARVYCNISRREFVLSMLVSKCCVVALFCLLQKKSGMWKQNHRCCSKVGLFLHCFIVNY